MSEKTDSKQVVKTAEATQATATPAVIDENYVKVSLINQGVTLRKKKSCPLVTIPLTDINYKNLKLLNKFVSEKGKILPHRITNVSAKKQRYLSQAIKRARHLALMSSVQVLS